MSIETEAPPTEVFRGEQRPDGPSELPDPIEPASPPPPIEDAAPAEEKPEPVMAYKLDPRNDIYARRSQALAADQGASDEVFDEARQNGRGLTSAEPAEPVTPVASSSEFVTIKVYGEERQAPKADVERAGGVAAYQKAVAADVKLENAARREAAVAAEEARLLRISENLRRGLDENGQPLAHASQPPSPGVTNAVSREAKQALIAGLYSGDSEEAEAALDRFVRELPNAVAPVVTPDVVGAVEARVLERIDTRETLKQEQADVAEANRIFRETFKDITADPDTMLWAKSLAGSLSQTPEFANKSRADIATEVGKRISAKLGKAAKPDPLQQRRELKGTLPRSSGGTVRSKEPEAPRPPSNADYIQQLRRNSGSNSSPR